MKQTISKSPSSLIYVYIFAFYLSIELPCHFPHLRSFIFMGKIIENQAVIIYVHLVDKKVRISEDLQLPQISQLRNWDLCLGFSA